MLKRLFNFFFFGNYFYGCCTVALAIEASLQQGLPLNSFSFYILLYSATVLFYTYAYVQEKGGHYTNTRTKWYAGNTNLIKLTQVIHFTTCTAITLHFLFTHYQNLQYISIFQLAVLGISGFIALAYYGIPAGLHAAFNLRNTGWLKPFVIGIVWAVMVTYIPVLWYQAEKGAAYPFSQFNAWFFIKNFMYISLLAILFDVKDFAADHNRKLKTFVVSMGVRKTIFYIIMPLAIAGFASFIVFASLLHFHVIRIVINSVPFILLLIVARSMQQRKSIVYYLVVIDGLMLAKALCGITGMLLVK